MKEGRWRRRTILRTGPQVAVDRRRVDDLAGVHQVVGVEERLHLPEDLVEAFAEKPFVVKRTDETIAVLRRPRAAIAADHLEGALGNRLQMPDVLGPAQVENRPQMDDADAGVRVERQLDAQSVAEGEHPLDVFGQNVDGDGGVFDKGEGLAIALHAEHQAEAALAHLPDPRLGGGVVEDRPGVAKLAGGAERLDPGELGGELVVRRSVELDDQDCVRVSVEESCTAAPSSGWRAPCRARWRRGPRPPTDRRRGSPRRRPIAVRTSW